MGLWSYFGPEDHIFFDQSARDHGADALEATIAGRRLESLLSIRGGKGAEALSLRSRTDTLSLFKDTEL